MIIKKKNITRKDKDFIKLVFKEICKNLSFDEKEKCYSTNEKFCLKFEPQFQARIIKIVDYI